jgi:uncharacterized protein (TIGR03083 family)
MTTIATPDIIGLINAEASHLRDFMASRPLEAWSKPSACAGWSVGDVFAHLSQGSRTWCASLTRAMAGDATPPPGEQPLRPGERGSEATAQRAMAFHREQGASGLLHAFTDGYQALHDVLGTLQVEDWDKPCYHRRGGMPVRDYVGIRLQELTIHGWDMRSAFDAAATLSEAPLPVVVGMAQRWLGNTFRPTPHLTTPLRYRFDVSGPVPVQHDVLVSQNGFRIEPIADCGADVTCRCTTGDYILLIYGRLPLDQAVHTARLEIGGDQAQAALFPTLFQGV